MTSFLRVAVVSGFDDQQVLFDVDVRTPLPPVVETIGLRRAICGSVLDDVHDVRVPYKEYTAKRVGSL